MKIILKSIAGILFPIILCNPVFASTIYENKQILWLDDLIWETAYEDAYNIYVKSTEQELNKEIKKLENDLSKIKIKDENGKLVRKYYSDMKLKQLPYPYVNAQIARWTPEKERREPRSYNIIIWGFCNITDSQDHSKSAQTNNIPVEPNKFIKSFYVAAMNRVLEGEKIK